MPTVPLSVLSPALIFALAVETPTPTSTPVDPATAPAPEPASTAPPTSTTTAPTTNPSANPSTSNASAWQKNVGISMIAGGAAVAAAGTATFTLVESLTTPDRRGQSPSETAQQFAEVAGFTSAALTSASAVVIVVGAALVLGDAP